MKFTHKSGPQEVALTIATPTFFKIVLLIIGTIILLGALRQAGHAMLLIFTAFFLALALNAPVQNLSQLMPGRLRGSRTAATAVSFFVVVAILGAFIGSLVPPLIKQTETFIATVPNSINSLRSEDSNVGQIIRKYNLENQVGNVSSQLGARLNSAVGNSFTTLSSIGSSVFSTLTVLVLTFMMLVEGPRWRRLIRSIIPRKRLDLSDRLSASMYRVIKGFVNGQVTLAALAAFSMLLGLLVLGIGYPIALVFIVFICGLIPMVGHTIGAAIVFVVALFTSLPAAIGILLWYGLYQLVENYAIQPRVQANSTDMSPLLVFGSVVIGVSFSGLLGGLVAIPVAGCIRIAILEYLKSRNLIHDPVVEAETEALTSGTR